MPSLDADGRVPRGRGGALQGDGEIAGHTISHARLASIEPDEARELSLAGERIRTFQVVALVQMPGQVLRTAAARSHEG